MTPRSPGIGASRSSAPAFGAGAGRIVIVHASSAPVLITGRADLWIIVD
ncbi:MAG: hypothetical protein QOE72_2063 [Chloroflexota bacterium]|jgi:hypothetical protein|nr:hypothetical protein [Chloroflexota bacterium]